MIQLFQSLFRQRRFYYLLTGFFLLGIIWGIGYRSFFLKPGFILIPQKKNLKVLALENTFPSDIIEGFQTHSKIEVDLAYFKTPEELLKFASENSFDVVVFKSYLANQLLEKKFLAPLDHARIQNWPMISHDFLGLSFDPENDFFVPLGWGLMGFLYLPSKWTHPPHLIKDFLTSTYEGKIALNPREEDLFFLAEKKWSIQKHSDDKLKAQALLEFQKLKLLAAQPPLPPFSITDVELQTTPRFAFYLSHGEGFHLAQNNKAWRFIVPEDGALLWTLNLALSHQSPNISLGYEFIDYMLAQEVAPDFAILQKTGTTVILQNKTIPDHLNYSYLQKLNPQSLTLARGRISP
ncbi:MAG: PotD/PotF family extracellular solute-binding protein [Bdellovibrionales bacterium]